MKRFSLRVVPHRSGYVTAFVVSIDIALDVVAPGREVVASEHPIRQRGREDETGVDRHC